MSQRTCVRIFPRTKTEDSKIRGRVLPLKNWVLFLL